MQDVKKVVEQIKADGRHEHRVHREVYRPWANMTLSTRATAAR
ncbi:hypothetical protein ACNKHR_23835 [Shigella flexneri]